MTNDNSFGIIAGSILTWLRGARQPNGGQNVEELNSVIGTSRGLVRSDNQDQCLLVRSKDHGWICSVLCDGIGGMLNGGLAAEIAASAFVEAIAESNSAPLRERLLRASEVANLSVHSRLSERGGTTLAALVVDRADSIYGVTIGDSRIYDVIPKKRLEQISFDDTIAGELRRIKGSEFRPDDNDPVNRHLSQYIGMGPGMQAHVYGPFDGEGWLLLTTDGIHSMQPKTLEQIAIHAPSPYKLATRLIQVAEWLGGYDNASIVVFPSHAKTHLLEAENEHIPGTLEIWSQFGKMHLVANALTGPKANAARESSPNQPQRERSPEPVSHASSSDLHARDKKRDRKRARKQLPTVQPQLGMELIAAEQMPLDPTGVPNQTSKAEPNGSNSESPSHSSADQETGAASEKPSVDQQQLPQNSPGG